MADEEIQEVRAIRHAISQECDHDVRKLAAYLRTVEAEMRKSGEFKFPNQTSNVTKRVSKSSAGDLLIEIAPAKHSERRTGNSTTPVDHQLTQRTN